MGLIVAGIGSFVKRSPGVYGSYHLAHDRPLGWLAQTPKCKVRSPHLPGSETAQRFVKTSGARHFQNHAVLPDPDQLVDGDTLCRDVAG